MAEKTDYTKLDLVENIHDLFRDRLNRTPNKTAYRYFDRQSESWEASTWSDMAAEIAQWQQALKEEDFAPGDTIAIMLRNSREWVLADQAALSLGLIVVPLYTEDRPDNVSYILNDASVQIIIIEGDEQWNKLYDCLKTVTSLKRILTVESMTGSPHDPRLRWLKDWVPDGKFELLSADIKQDAIASIVYTSGTTGRPKGVMLSHLNIIWNVQAALSSVTIYPSDTFISFLPLSHTLERTIGYYLAICGGATVAYARSVQDLGEDMLTIKPTVLITVPRIFERIYNKIHMQLNNKSSIAVHLFHDAIEVGYKHFLYKQKRSHWRPSFLLLPLLKLLVAKKVQSKFGSRIRFCISGGAPLSSTISKTFIGLGINILQGYGLTEHSPVISANSIHRNEPASVGPRLPGVELKVSDKGELLVRSPSVMVGYLNNKDATDEVIDEEGWLYTGDKVEIRNDYIYITGRLKEIIIMSNGEKVPPSDIEMAIQQDPVFEQVVLIGESRPFLSALVVLNLDAWKSLAIENNIDWFESPVEDQQRILLDRIAAQLSEFPGFAQIHQVRISEEPWTIDNAMLTPTLKLRRKQINAKNINLIENMYAGH